jgi:hypothetical protein
VSNPIADVSLDCEVTSRAAVTANVYDCSPTSAGADICWSAPPTSMLGLDNPWDKELRRFPLSTLSLPSVVESNWKSSAHTTFGASATTSGTEEVPARGTASTGGALRPLYFPAAFARAIVKLDDVKRQYADLCGSHPIPSGVRAGVGKAQR